MVITLNQDANLVRCYVAEKEAAPRAALVSSLFQFRLTIAGLILAAALVVSGFRDIPITWMLAVGSACPLLLLGGNLPYWVMQGNHQSHLIYRTQAIGSVLGAALYLGFFRRGAPAGSDVLVAVVVSIITFYLGWRAAVGFGFRFNFAWRNFSAAWKIFKHGRWLAVTGLVIYLYSNAELPLLGYLGGVVDAGRYRVAQVPASVIASFIAMLPTIIYPRFVQLAQQDRVALWHHQCEIARRGLWLVLPFSLLTWLLLPVILRLVYGPIYVGAFGPAAILVIAKYVVAINGIFSWGLWAQGRDRSMLGLFTAVAAVSLVSNICLIPRFGIWAAVLINLASEVLVLVGSFWLARRLAASVNDSA